MAEDKWALACNRNNGTGAATGIYADGERGVVLLNEELKAELKIRKIV